VRFRESVILDEVVDRWLVAVAALVSVYVTFRGHNAPGGGFAGGLILGAAFVLQYLTGREPEIRGRAIRQPTGLLGAGLLLALATTVAPSEVLRSSRTSGCWTYRSSAI
jgi:multicomponent Na+:H+ antiporter subunit A